ncbi:hypothetical protein ACFYPN_07745 [Streptomyces sp. NPDC005576]|uniref:hypothetical protein n=1 Tax=unclassified Streptomyces TaxID=2593676 RepID=UPI0033C9093F
MSNGVGKVPEHRPGTATAHHIPHTLLCALTALLTACLVAFGTTRPAEAAPDDDLVKVFVVPDPAQAGGQLATLGSIAGATLGDPGRADEIFTLNRGLAQKDGVALDSPDDQLRPGWILRLPQDAAGPAVQLARDAGGRGSAAAPPGPGSTPAPAPGGQYTVLTIPLAAALALLGAVLLALITASIVGRRKVRAGYTAVRRGVHRLNEPVRRRRSQARRRSTSRWFDTDLESVRRAYGTLDEFAATDREPAKAVHAVCVEEAGLTVWLPASETAAAPWSGIGTTRWRRPDPAPTRASGSASRTLPADAFLVRAGTNTEGRPVFVDLSRLDGVLSVGGDKTVARDVVQNLLAEIARTRPNTPVTVLHGPAGTLPLTVPPNLRQRPALPSTAAASPLAAHVTVSAGASRRPVKGLVVVAGPPGPEERAELAALCGPGGAGWTGLVCGETQDAHWRWYADGAGHVDIPVLDLRLTVPA